MKIIFINDILNNISFAEEIDLNKRKNSKVCIVCRYWSFNLVFNFKTSVCNGSLDLLMMITNISNIAAGAIKNAPYHCIIYKVNKFDAIDLLENSMLDDCGFI